MDLTDLYPNRLVQTRRGELLKVSTIYPGYVTAKVELPPQPRTTVRSYLPDEIRTWRKPSRAILDEYDAQYPPLSLTSEQARRYQEVYPEYTVTELRRRAVGMPYRAESAKREVVAWLVQYQPEALA